MLMSGENPWYKHACAHPDSLAHEKSRPSHFGGLSLTHSLEGREIGDTDNTPEWCPVIFPLPPETAR
jgi:hypothetical protein